VYKVEADECSHSFKSRGSKQDSDDTSAKQPDKANTESVKEGTSKVHIEYSCQGMRKTN
jgi:hypothetical protein